MDSNLDKRTIYRSLGRSDFMCRRSGFYADRKWINDMDIVNELGAHTGCVNALSWSDAGDLLASGSDDCHVHIFSYQPEDSSSPFALHSTIHTGHRANIFSVKFMPHTNNRTMVTCAADHQVRVFDLEYSARAREATDTSPSSFSSRMRNRHRGIYSFSDDNTNCRIYRCHTDSVKRIITESSPNLFLTCSEDGEVRQWDLRQPSSAYPAQSRRRGDLTSQVGRAPDPLISYKQHRIELNAMSCSPTQPWYIALGGGHLHCFLHDRRMLGRDLLSEKGDPGLASPPIPGSRADSQMDAATRCVRRFAPYGLNTDNGRGDRQITACKISNYNPNEMIASWSGDHVYSFDIIRSPDAREGHDASSTGESGRNSYESSSEGAARKRKRAPNQQDRGQPSRPSPSEAMRVRYGSGEPEDVSTETLTQDAMEGINEDTSNTGRELPLSSNQQEALDIATGVRTIRDMLFQTRQSELLSEESTILAQIEELATRITTQAASMIRSWRPAIHPTPAQRSYLERQKQLRQITYCLARLVRDFTRILREHRGESEPWTMLDDLEMVSATPIKSRETRFCYLFTRALVAFAHRGRTGILQQFTRRPPLVNDHDMFPLQFNAPDEAIGSTLIPHLDGLAGMREVVNLDVNRFETTEHRVIFDTQHEAVQRLSELLRASAYVGDNGEPTASRFTPQNDEATYYFWMLGVGRSILHRAFKILTFEKIKHAFGGSNMPTRVGNGLGASNGHEQEHGGASPGVNGEGAESSFGSQVARGVDDALLSMTVFADDTSSGDDTEDDEDSELDEDMHMDSGSDIELDTDLDDEGDDGEHGFNWHTHSDSEDDSDDSQDSDDDSDSEADSPHRRQPELETHAPLLSHQNVYRGHCNVQTIKDVDYFGENDEYVVSGSDSGHLFIWDRKTAKIVNILKGDEDVVNVIRGHPYEPMMAVSGIDDTVKIFSPDQHAQHLARQGIGIANPDLHYGGQAVSGTTSEASNSEDENEEEHVISSDDADDEQTEDDDHSTRARRRGQRRPLGLRSRKCMADLDRIVSENETVRKEGLHKAFMTRQFLAYLAQRMEHQRGEGGPMTGNENCTVM